MAEIDVLDGAAVNVIMRKDPQNGMVIEQWPIDVPVDYPKNARRWGSEALAKVATSIREFGFIQPVVVDREGVIIIGHLRRAAARTIPLATIPVYVAYDLSPAQVRQLRLMDNRSHQEATWDWGILSEELLGMRALDIDLSFTGFDSSQLTTLLRSGKDAKAKRGAAAAELRELWGVEAGQTWQVGRHSIICGDSLTVVPQGADGVVTDPPYGIDDEPFLATVIKRHSQLALMLASDRIAFGLAKYLDFRLDLIWKHAARKFPTKHIPIMFHTHVAIFAAAPGIKTHWTKPRADYGSIIECENEYEDAAMGHGKAAEIFERAMEGFAKWKTICDPFAGTCATVLAAENTGRTCTAIEIDPNTAAIALQRMVDAGMAKPVLDKVSA